MRAGKDGCVFGADGIVSRARAAVGAPYRAQGRDVATGLDCVGLVAFALAVPASEVPGGYRLRGRNPADVSSCLRRVGLAEVEAGTAGAGDLAVFAAGVGQIHLGIITEIGIVHADAALRRVVERPGPAPWPIASLWRAVQDNQGDCAWQRSS